MLTRLTFRQLEYCAAAGAFGSISEAASRIHVSPSSISAAIAQLESELRVTLFVRHHAQGLSVTPAGAEVLTEIRNLLMQASALYDIAARAQNDICGPVRVGCLTTLAAMVAPELCLGFQSAYPRARVTQVEDHQEGLIDKLRHAQIDVAITYDLLIGESDIAFEPLACLPPLAIVSELHPLAEQHTTTLQTLAQNPMVLLDLPLSRDYFMALFRDADLSPQIAARSSSPDVVRSLVANGFGYSLVNVRPRNHHSLDGKRLVNLRLSGHHRPMKLGLAWASGHKPRHVVEAFMHRCRNFISDAYIPGMAQMGDIDGNASNSEIPGPPPAQNHA